MDLVTILQLYGNLTLVNLHDAVVNTFQVLNQQSGFLTLVSILTAIGAFFYQQHNEKRKFNERIVNACKTLLTDLADLEEFYSSSKDKMTILSEHDIEYTNTSIGREYYQSIVNSGLITYFDEKTQVELSDLYYDILMFNEWLRELNHLIFFSPLYDWTTRKRMAQKLTKHEREIKTKLPVVRKLLDAEIRKLNKLT